MNLFFVVVVFLIMKQTQTWIPKLKIVYVDCEKVIIFVLCPDLMRGRNVELKIHELRGDRYTDKRRLSKICKSGVVKFEHRQIICRSLYYYVVSASRKPVTQVCDEYCQTAFKSKVYLLGNVKCPTYADENEGLGTVPLISMCKWRHAIESRSKKTSQICVSIAYIFIVSLLLFISYYITRRVFHKKEILNLSQASHLSNI